jgi:flagellar biosynthetic protein FliP
MSAPTRHFVRHYVEMVVAMFLGMGVLLPPLGAALRAAGTSLHDSDVLMISAMALTMTAPMVAWMRYRGHGWPVCADMTAAMAIPTLSVLALLWSGLVDDLGTLLLIEHVAMLPSMLVAMLLRRDEYTGAVHRHARQQVAA